MTKGNAYMADTERAAAERERCERTFRASKYMQVVYAPESFLAYWDGWQASRAQEAPAQGWRAIDTAPRDGSTFLARCMRRYPFSAGPIYFPDIAWWSGNTPDDRLGHWASRSGDLVVGWSPIPAAAPPLPAAAEQQEKKE